MRKFVSVPFALMRLGVFPRAPFHGAVIEIQADQAQGNGNREHNHGKQVLAHAEGVAADGGGDNGRERATVEMKIHMESFMCVMPAQ